MNRLVFISLALITSLLLGCGGGNSNSTGIRTVPVTLNFSVPARVVLLQRNVSQPDDIKLSDTQAPSLQIALQHVMRWLIPNAYAIPLPAAVGAVQLIISGPGMTALTDTIVLTPGTTVTRTYDVPVGVNRIFRINALDRSGRMLAQGSSSIAEIQAGVPVALDIPMVIVETVPPVITLLGLNPVAVERGGTYINAGATALDNLDGNITANIVTTNLVNTMIAGAYAVKYNVTDAAGNRAIQVTRVVNVVDTVPPTLSSIHIASNNANLRQAKAGDVITLTFTASEVLGTLPVATIATQTVSVLNTGGLNYRASYIMRAADAQGIVPFTVDFIDVAGNTGMQATGTTDASAVTYNNNTLPVAGTPAGKVLQFDGINDYLAIAHHVALHFAANQSFTIQVWVKTTAANVRNVIFHQDESAGSIAGIGSTSLRFDASGAPVVEITDSLGTMDFLTDSLSKINDGAWHHLAMVRDVQAGVLALFVDGNPPSLSGSMPLTATGIIANNDAENDSFYLAAEDTLAPGGLINFTAESLADFRIYDYARSPIQVFADMQGRVTGHEPGLMGYWPLDEGSGVTSSDHTNANAAILGAGTAAPIWTTAVFPFPPNTFTVGVNSYNSLALPGRDAEGNPLSARIDVIATSGVLHQTSDGITAGAAISVSSTNVTDSSRRIIYVAPPPAFPLPDSNDSFTYSLADPFGFSPSTTISVNTSRFISYALRFDGADDNVIIPDNPAINFGTGDFTIELWLQAKLPLSGSVYGLLDKRCCIGGNPPGYEILYQPGFGIGIQVSDGTNWTNLFPTIAGSPSQPFIIDELPHHVAVVVDRTITNTVQIYIDGLAAATEFYTAGFAQGSASLTAANINGSTTSLGTLHIGEEFFGNSWSGNIYDVRLWNTTRTAGQIASDMINPLTGTEPGLVGYWKMGESLGVTAHDSSNTSNHGTLGNGMLVKQPTWVVQP